MHNSKGYSPLKHLKPFKKPNSAHSLCHATVWAQPAACVTARLTAFAGISCAETNPALHAVIDMQFCVQI